MKKKRTTMLLLVLVLVIWSILIYRIYHSFYGNNKVKLQISDQKIKSGRKEFQSYQLHSYNRDPFLSIISDTATATVVIEAKTPKIPERKPLTLPQFCGTITNKKNRTAIFIASRRVYFLHEGDSFQRLIVKKIFEDSVACMNDGTKVTIPLVKKRK